MMSVQRMPKYPPLIGNVDLLTLGYSVKLSFSQDCGVQWFFFGRVSVCWHCGIQ